MTKRERNELDKKIKNMRIKLVEAAYEYLKKVAPGSYTNLSIYFERKYGKDFIYVLIEDPIKAYRGLIEHYGGADFVVELMLQEILKRSLNYDIRKVRDAISALKAGNAEKFKKILSLK